MITVHHLEHSRSQRILWLLEELELPYQITRYARDPKTQLAPPELRAVHPLGKSPVITDGQVTVAESGAIIEYLLDSHGQGRLRPPAGGADHRRFVYWLHFAEGSAMPPLLLKLVFDKLRQAPAPFFLKPVLRAIASKVTRGFIAPNLESQLAFMESELASRKWFAGRAFSAADIQMSFPVEAAMASGLIGSAQPNLLDWLQRIHDRPAYGRALERGGPYKLSI